MEKHKWFTLADPEKIDSPALLIFPERAKKNIAEMVRIAGNADRLMPHVKTHKMAEVTKLMLEAGISRFKCATIAEVEMVAMSGAKSVLMAYQLSATKAARFIKLIKKFPDSHFSSLVDNKESADMLNGLLKEHNLTGTVYIDVNNGMNRTGISVDADVPGLFAYLQTLSNLRCRGLHVYDGHFHSPGYEERVKKVQESFAPVEDIITQIEKTESTHPEVVAGGSPTFPVHAMNPRVLCSPGTNVFWDAGYANSLPEQQFEWAAVLLTRIISKPNKGIITTDLGHKSVASENPLNKRAILLNLDKYDFVSQSEEHLVLKVADEIWQHLSVGDVLYAIPWHICPTVALYDEVSVIEDGLEQTIWPVTARGRRITI